MYEVQLDVNPVASWFGGSWAIAAVSEFLDVGKLSENVCLKVQKFVLKILILGDFRGKIEILSTCVAR